LVHCGVAPPDYDTCHVPTTCFQLWHGPPPPATPYSPAQHGDKWNAAAPPTPPGGWLYPWIELAPGASSSSPQVHSGWRVLGTVLVLGGGPDPDPRLSPSWRHPSHVDGAQGRTYACLGCGDFNPPRVKRRATRAKDDDEMRAALSVLSPRDRAAAEFRSKVSADAKRATAEGSETLGAVLAAASPLRSPMWWALKHPFARLSLAVFVLWANLFVYLGDPASYSGAKSYGTLVGDIYHGFLQPDDPGW
jgi:hypothetical protein